MRPQVTLDEILALSSDVLPLQTTGMVNPFPPPEPGVGYTRICLAPNPEDDEAAAGNAEGDSARVADDAKA
ncbi:uncharacterized protein LOC62_04G006100 [Vanrija pseudolonga]|uniref:Uncharacterized protein n=1 Tax=Vanrija pseudolonga TaxID=143232 RepID=A0AAF1BLT9_9TREE|nr:hypothetical protein LOC62_04G006100 [Vanrija pseudolonga]